MEAAGYQASNLILHSTMSKMYKTLKYTEHVRGHCMTPTHAMHYKGNPSKILYMCIVWFLQKWIYFNDPRNVELRKSPVLQVSGTVIGTIILQKKMASLKLANWCHADSFIKVTPRVLSCENQPFKTRPSKILKNVKFLLVGNLQKWT